MLSDEKLAIMERFGSADIQELVAEVRASRLPEPIRAVAKAADIYVGAVAPLCTGYPDCYGEDEGPCEHCAMVAAVKRMRESIIA